MYHEVLSISNCYNHLTSKEFSFRETDLHHELGGNVSYTLTSARYKVVSFIEERGNPFETSAVSKLHHFTTGQCVPDEASKRLLTFFEHGENGYAEFRKERFVEKDKKLSDTIKKVNFPLFDPKSKQKNLTQTTTSKLVIKEISQAQRSVDIARSRLITMTELLDFDLTAQNPLFDGDFTTKPAKHLLIAELEKNLVGVSYVFENDGIAETGLVIDFMSLIRKMNISKMHIFKNAFEAAWKSIKNVCSFSQLDVIYDSYIENSVKY